MKQFLSCLLVAGLVAGCGSAQRPDFDAPPTEREHRILGVDALDDYFLTRWRKCNQWKSESACKSEIYGGDGGFP